MIALIVGVVLVVAGLVFLTGPAVAAVLTGGGIGVGCLVRFVVVPGVRAERDYRSSV